MTNEKMMKVLYGNRYITGQINLKQGFEKVEVIKKGLKADVLFESAFSIAQKHVDPLKSKMHYTCDSK